MRLYVAVIAALAMSTLTLAHEDKYERMLKRWVKTKAMEGCFGEENVKGWIVKMKKAKAVCCKKPAPELHLPYFNKPVRVANALLGVSSSGLTAQQEDFIDNKMRNRFIAKLMAKEMDAMALDDDAAPYFINKYAMNRRFTREAEDEDAAEGVMDDDYESLDIADMMVDKLEDLKDSFEAEIGNMTCVLQEIGMLDENNELDIVKMNECLDEGKYTAEESADGIDRTWLQAKLKTVHAMCKDLSDAVPESVLNSCSLPHWMTRLKFFHKCMKFHKIESCMHSDMRHKLTGKGLDIEELTQKAGLANEEELTGLMSMMFFKKH